MYKNFLNKFQTSKVVKLIVTKKEFVVVLQCFDQQSLEI